MNDINTIMNTLDSLQQYTDLHSEEYQHIEDAMFLLRKQIPSDIDIIMDTFDYDIRALCPNCGNFISPSRNVKYCELCGQRLNWHNRIMVNGKIVNMDIGEDVW